MQATRDLFYIEDRELEIDQIINECRLPSAPRQVTFKCHWLAINGVQPEIPQNPPKPSRQAAAAQPGENASGDAAAPGGPSAAARAIEEAEIKPPVRHVLTKEQQLFFEKITSTLLGVDPTLYHAAINSLRTDKGLHQLMPYFCKFITDKVSECTQRFNMKILVAIMKMVEALLMNPDIHVDHYVRLVIRYDSNEPTDNFKG